MKATAEQIRLLVEDLQGKGVIPEGEPSPELDIVLGHLASDDFLDSSGTFNLDWARSALEFIFLCEWDCSLEDWFKTPGCGRKEGVV